MTSSPVDWATFERIMPRHVYCVGWGGKVIIQPARLELGFSARRPPEDCLRRLVWDIAFGYCNGFPASAILWFILTRTLSPRRVTDRVIEWEERKFARGGLS